MPCECAEIIRLHSQISSYIFAFFLTGKNMRINHRPIIDAEAKVWRSWRSKKKKVLKLEKWYKMSHTTIETDKTDWERRTFSNLMKAYPMNAKGLLQQHLLRVAHVQTSLSLQ